jgi:hypothetical protein
MVLTLRWYPYMRPCSVGVFLMACSATDHPVVLGSTLAALETTSVMLLVAAGSRGADTAWQLLSVLSYHAYGLPLVLSSPCEFGSLYHVKSWGTVLLS